MFKCTLITLVTSLLVFVLADSSLAQQRIEVPQPKEHRMSVYETEDGKFYINRNLPIFLSFSIGEDNGKKMYRLKQDLGEGNEPFFLDTEGVNYIRSKWAVDPKTKQAIQPKREAMFPVYADGEYPQTNVRFLDANGYRKRDAQFYGKGLKVELKAKDAMSGLSKTYVSLNSRVYVEYTEPIIIPQEQDYNLYFYSVDMVGNQEPIQMIRSKFTVDITAPESKYTLSGAVHKGNIIGASGEFLVASKDNITGTSEVYYAFDDGPRKRFDSRYPVNVNQLEEGEHTVYYWSKDNVNNVEERNAFKFYLDKTAPELQLELLGDTYQGKKYTYVSDRTRVELTGTDNYSGLRRMSYSFDGGDEVAYRQPFPIPANGGIRKLGFYGVDNVFNMPPRKIVPLYMDNVSPVSSLKFSAPTFSYNDTLYISNKTKISIRSKDAASGVQAKQYSFGNNRFVRYDSAFTMQREGMRSIYFNAMDNVNNKEALQEYRLIVDNTPPEISANFSIKAKGSVVKDGKTVMRYPNYVRLYLGATDKSSGADKIEYSFDGKNFKPYSSPQTIDMSEQNAFAQEALYNVTVRAYDKLGNRSEKTFEFYVGR